MRRSGGGAVLVVPLDLVWVDIVLAARCRARRRARVDDLGRECCWRRALDARVAGVGAELAVHERPVVDAVVEPGLLRRLGPGEVLLDGRKLVGLSQRRTRHGLRIQGLVHRRHPSIDVAGLLRPPIPIAPLPEPAVLARRSMSRRLVEHLASSLTRTD